MPRKPLSKRTRFEVFKRDDFTCQYCGRRTPTVVLEVDHVVAVKAGGANDLENLVTSCEECNRGKSSVPLTSVAQVVDVAARTAQIGEREDQLRAYNDVQNMRAERIERDFNEVWNFWFDTWGTTKLRGCDVPWESTIRKNLDLLSVAEIKDAVRITLNHGKNGDSRRYFVGVLRHMVAEREGRVVYCPYCNGRMVVDPGEPLEGWYHVECKEKADSA